MEKLERIIKLIKMLELDDKILFTDFYTTIEEYVKLLSEKNPKQQEAIEQYITLKILNEMIRKYNETEEFTFKDLMRENDRKLTISEEDEVDLLQDKRLKVFEMIEKLFKWKIELMKPKRIEMQMVDLWFLKPVKIKTTLELVYKQN